MKTTAVIMAGGGGTRFWPLSRVGMPKQVLNITGGDTMINLTIARCEGLVGERDTYIVTNAKQKDIVSKVLKEGVPKENILLEPLARNTAPCILLAALKLQSIYGDGVMAVFSSDHYISDEAGFKRVFRAAIEAAVERDQLVTIGIQPSFASTGYGYIEYDMNSGQGSVYEVSRFVEKPDRERAEAYLRSGNYLWNSGMFVWKVSTIISQFERFLPRIYKQMQRYAAAMGTEAEAAALKEAYEEIQPISIDYGILERSNEVLVLPGDFGWNDVGSWDALASVFPPDPNGNVVKADYLGLDTKGCVIYGQDEFVATIGLRDMIVVHTSDALLVCPKDRAHDVKEIVAALRKKGRDELL
jgi:mannose-1-phosphate guanylyltransferase